MTLGEHLEELRRCLLRAVVGAVVGTGLALLLVKHLFRVFWWPLAVATAGQPPNLFVRGVPEGFTIYLRISLIAGLVLSSPYVLYQVWSFVAAGLYEHERRAVRRYLMPSVLLFLLGVSFYFVCISWVVVRFFLTFVAEYYPPPPMLPSWLVEFLRRYFGSPPPVAPAAPGEPFVRPWLTLDEYISFTGMMSLVFGLAFQTPLVVTFLARTGIVPVRSLRRFRRYVVVIVAVAAAVITPTGDAVTMLALAVPIYLLYELGILVAARRSRAKPPA